MTRWMVLVGLLAIGCAPRQNTGAEEATPAVVVAGADSAAISLERTACFGTCPVYRVVIFRTGLVRFTGLRFTAHVGDTSAQIPPARVDSLLAELQEGGYFGFADAYEPGTESCGRAATDNPSATSAVVLDGRRKEIRHYYGCPAAPQTLVHLERRIDEVAGTDRWTRTEE